MIHTVMVAASLVAMVLSPCLVLMAALPERAIRALSAFPGGPLEVVRRQLLEC